MKKETGIVGMMLREAFGGQTAMTYPHLKKSHATKKRNKKKVRKSKR